MSKSIPKKAKKIEEVTRNVRLTTQCELWGRAAGRCQFKGHNILLYISAMTQNRVNVAQKAHIYSFSKDGPRGWGPFKTKQKNLNDVHNLMLVCGACHTEIDQNEQLFTAELLQQWKHDHEERVRITTGIHHNLRSHVVVYGAAIGDVNSPLIVDDLHGAMIPEWFPVNESPINISTFHALTDVTPEYWAAEKLSLEKSFRENIKPRIRDAASDHFSIFAKAPQPLLILLGALFTDNPKAVVYQLHREPPSWRWKTGDAQTNIFKVTAPVDTSKQPALKFSLSASIDDSRIKDSIGSDCSIWEVKLDSPHNDFLDTPAQLQEFREVIRKLMVKIKLTHPSATELKLFPAMPIACAVELGRIRMPKADLPWRIYDQNNEHRKFIETITVGTNHE